MMKWDAADFLVFIKVILYGLVCNTLVFLLIHIRLIPGDTIFYITFKEALQSPVAA